MLVINARKLLVFFITANKLQGYIVNYIIKKDLIDFHKYFLNILYSSLILPISKILIKKLACTTDNMYKKGTNHYEVQSKFLFKKIVELLRHIRG